MAIVLQFKQGDSGTTLSLNSASAGFSLAGWSPSVATPVHMGDPAPIGESIHLRLKQANQNTLATSMQSLHEMQVLADRYINDPTQETPVWLHAKMANETGERRALVYSISVQYKSSWFGPEATAEDIPLVLNVVRGPYWESTSVRDLPDSGSKTGAGVVYDYTAAGSGGTPEAHDYVGDVGARLRFFDMESTDALEVVWMGIRSAAKRGSTGLSNFINIWECEDGTNVVDATDTVDATASGADNVTVAESANNWDDGNFVMPMYLDLADISANEIDQFGTFLWLLRASPSASTTWEIYLQTTYGGTEAQVTNHPIVEINSGADWDFYELGISSIPRRDFRAITLSDLGDGYEADMRLHLYARRTSGTGNLLLDCLVPIPVDEGFCKIYVPTAFLNTNLSFGVSPQGGVSGVSHFGVIDTLAEIKSFNNFTLPPGDGRIYAAFSQGGKSDITDDITFNDVDAGKYYERWLSLRGSE